jgi:hypothetical protein
MCNCGKRRVVAAAPVAGGGGRGVGGRGVRGVAAPAPAFVVPMVPMVPMVPVAPRTTYIPLHPSPAVVAARPVARQAPVRRRVAVNRDGGRGGGAVMGPVVEEDGPIVDPALWGPPLWRLLHTLAEMYLSAPSIGIDDWSQLLAALRTSLPCPECTRHYESWFTLHPFTADPAAWLLALHNDVNRRRGVSVVWTLQDVRATYGVAMMTDLQAMLTRVRGLMVGEAACAVLERMIESLM